MENTELELLKRAEELSRRCEKSGEVTHTCFLTPAEQYLLSGRSFGDAKPLFFGGTEGCERRIAFFLPEWFDGAEPCFDDYICAAEIKAGFGEPSHRDYLGALMGLGIKREWIGDIHVRGDTATVFFLPSVKRHICDSLTSVGRFGVKVRELPLCDVPPHEVAKKSICFSVKSPRLDAVCAGMFNLSRSSVAGYIAQGEVTLNYKQCLKCDAAVSCGDVISLRGKGKGIVGEQSGKSRKDRIFLNAEIFI